jgi:hypothetical protein
MKHKKQALLPKSKPTTKLFKIGFAEALDACGEGESVLEVLDILQKEGSISGYTVMLEIRMDASKVAQIENFFLLKQGREEYEG